MENQLQKLYEHYYSYFTTILTYPNLAHHVFQLPLECELQETRKFCSQNLTATKIALVISWALNTFFKQSIEWIKESKYQTFKFLLLIFSHQVSNSGVFRRWYYFSCLISNPFLLQYWKLENQRMANREQDVCLVYWFFL